MERISLDKLIPILACPNCYRDVVPEDIRDTDGVLSGRLRCSGCSASYPIRESVMFLIVPDVTWKCVLQEVVSWRSYELEQDFLVKSGRVLNGRLEAEVRDEPFMQERDARFEEAFSEIKCAEGTLACEVAAFKCQQALSLTRRGARVIATDAWFEPLIYGPGGEGECRLIPKICCHVERLPFKSGVFDLAYVRAAIHHFEHPSAAIREMGRITHRGGHVAIITEPSYYPFGKSSKDEVCANDVPFLMGMNETTISFPAYLLAMLRAGLRVQSCSYYSPSFAPMLSRLLALLGTNPDKLLKLMYRWGKAHGLSLLTLLPVRCIASFIAERNRSRISFPDSVPRHDLLFTIDEFLDRSLPNLTALWKRTLTPAEVPRAITVGRNDLLHLRRGWGRPESICGITARWTHYIAYAFLRRDAGDEEMEIECLAPIQKIGAPLRCEISIDEGPWSEFTVRSEHPEIFRFSIPPDAGDIVDIRLRTPEPWQGSALYPGRYDHHSFFGIAVARLGTGRQLR